MTSRTLRNADLATAIEITGIMEAWEDSFWNDPAGNLLHKNHRDGAINLTVNGVTIARDDTAVAGTYGSLTIDQNGYWEYTLDNSNAAVEALDGDDDDTDGGLASLTETIRVTYADATGRTATRSFDITINGRTDFYLDEDSAFYDDVYGRTFYQVPYSSRNDDRSFHGQNANGDVHISDAWSTVTHDIFHGNDESNGLYGGDGDDVLYGYGGDDRLSGGGGTNILDGGEGSDFAHFVRFGYSYKNVVIDLGSDVRWKYNRASGEWESGTGDGYEYIRAAYAYDTSGSAGSGDFEDGYDYLKDIENIWIWDSFSPTGSESVTSRLTGDDDANRFDITGGYNRADGGGGDDVIRASDGNNHVDGGGGDDSISARDGNNHVDGGGGDDTISASGGNSHVDGGGGDDRISTSVGNNVLIGGKGHDVLSGGSGADTFVLYQGAHQPGETNLDIVTDFSWGDDKIRIDTAEGDETTLSALRDAAGIRWTQSHVDTRSSNDATIRDTVIYDTRGTVSEDDDIMLMVLEDYTANLTLRRFEILTSMESIATISGVREAWEDSVWNDPAGNLLREGHRDGAINLTVNGVVIAYDHTAVEGTYGSLTIDRNGYWEYTLNQSNAAVEVLDGDDDDTDGARGSLTETIRVIYADEVGRTVTKSFDITINGRTDVYLGEDQVRSSYFAPSTLQHDDLSIHGQNVNGGINIYGGTTSSTHDILHGNDQSNRLVGKEGNDVLYGYEGDDVLVGNRGNDILHGGGGNDTAIYYGSRYKNVVIDLGSDVRWKYNRASGEWENGTEEEGYEYIRAEYHYAYGNSGGREFRPEYDYLKDIENIEMSRSYAESDNEIIGDDGVNDFWLSAAKDVVNGAGGNDLIRTRGGNDTLIGGKGHDILSGGSGADTFVLYQGEHEDGETNLDIVVDFAFGDKIRIETTDGDEATLAALRDAAGIRWARSRVDTGESTNSSSTWDTVIYDTHGTAAISDDTMLMVLEDYTTDLTMAQFEVI